MPNFNFSSFIAAQATPFYFYDAEIITARCAELATFDVVRYAQKACSNTAILRLVQQCGAVVDAVSANEIRRALHAGFSPNKNPRGAHEIVYTSDIFDADALELVVHEKIHVNCGTLDMIAQYGEKLRSENLYATENYGEITLRINPGFGHGHSRKTNTGGDTSKHGIWHAQAADTQKLAAQYHLRMTGLHVHIGSGTDLAHLAQVADFVENFAPHFAQTLTTISAGGGLPVPYRPHDVRMDLAKYYAIWDAAKTRLENRLGRKLRLEVEPGRYLVAESGVLVTTICAIKKQGENTFYLVDAGFNDLARAAMYGAYHPMRIIHKNRANENDSENQSREKIEVIVGGPLCESGDIFTQEEGGIVVKRLLPRASVGDFLLIENTGAYGAAMSSNYNSRALAAEFLLENNVPRLIRRRQTFADIISGEET